MAINPTRALERSLNIARLHTSTMEEVEADTSSTIEAGLVLVASGVIGALGTLIVDGFGAFLAWVIATIGGWFVWGFVSAKIAERLFNVETTNTGEMLRVIGYGSAPRVIGVIPFIGWIGALWTMVALVLGIRQAGEMTLVQAVITAFVGLVPTLIAYFLILAFL